MVSEWEEKTSRTDKREEKNECMEVFAPYAQFLKPFLLYNEIYEKRK